MAGNAQRIRLLVFGWLTFGALLVAVLVPGTPAQADKQWSSQENNVELFIPDGIGAWDWLPYNSQWKKPGIVKGAQRKLKELKSGEKAKGEGAVMHLAIRDAKEGMKLADTRDADDIREFLLSRLHGKHSEIEVENYTVAADGNGEHPCLVFRTEGEGYNLEGKIAKAEASVTVTIARGKLYLYRLYAFPTEYDPEGLSNDLSLLEGSGFALITAKEDAKKDAKKGPPPKADDGDKKADEPERKDEMLFWADLECRLVLDKKLMRLEITDEEKADHLILKCADSDARGSYAFYIYAPPTVQYTDGVAGQPQNILKWITVTWWNNFTNTHPKGELATFKWPRKPVTKGAKTFMTLPDFEDEEARKVVFEKDAKRPAEVSSSDMIKKLGFCEKVKKHNIGRKGKVGEAHRGCMQGKRQPSGQIETAFRWAFRYNKTGTSYRVFVIFRGDSWKKWGTALRKTLESWEFGVKE